MVGVGEAATAAGLPSRGWGGTAGRAGHTILVSNAVTLSAGEPAQWAEWDGMGWGRGCCASLHVWTMYSAVESVLCQGRQAVGQAPMAYTGAPERVGGWLVVGAWWWGVQVTVLELLT